MRKIVTEVANGRSRALIDEQVPAAPLAMLWDASPDRPLGYPPAEAREGNPEVAPGQTSWRIATVPPEVVMRQYLASGIPGLDEKGFHSSKTVNYIMVLDKPLTLALDDGEFDLQPGDLVVQRATRHAWFNRGDEPAHLLILMNGLTDEAIEQEYQGCPP
jgi:quercetin dioxygenase-like cupin family protein